MNTIIIDGSPLGKRSASLKVALAFARGIENISHTPADIVHLSEKNILPCKGCLHCWMEDCGECVIKNDDVKEIQERLLNADIAIFSFPLYYFGMPALLCNFLERCVCMAHSYRGTNGNTQTGGFLHEWRYEKMNSQKNVFVSTCGYEFANENYDGVRKRLDLIFGNNHTDIFVGQGGVIAEKTLENIVAKYLERFTEAGEEFAQNMALSEDTIGALAKPVLRHNTFVRALNMHWGLPAPKEGNK